MAALLFLAHFNIGDIEYISVLTGKGNQELGFEGTGQSRINLYNLPDKLEDDGTQNLCKGTDFCYMRTKGQGQILWRLQGKNWDHAHMKGSERTKYKESRLVSI